MQRPRAGRGLATAALVIAGAVAPAPAPADTVGMTADRITRSVTVFDADTHAVIGALALPDQDGATVGDCTISRDERLGYVTDFKNRVWVIDLDTAALADGINPIPITTPGNDIDVTPNGRHLLACDGEGPGPISIVDLETRAEIETSTSAATARRSRCATTGACWRRPASTLRPATPCGV